MILRIHSPFDWRIPNAGLSVVAFAPGDYAVGVQPGHGSGLPRMTRIQAAAAIAAKRGDWVKEEQKSVAAPKKPRN